MLLYKEVLVYNYVDVQVQLTIGVIAQVSVVTFENLMVACEWDCWMWTGEKGNLLPLNLKWH